MAVTHSTVVVVADDGTSPVGTNEWNADHVTAAVSLSAVSANKDQLLIPDTTAGAGLTIGGDVNLYRSFANVLKTDDAFQAIGFMTTFDHLHADGSLGNGYIFVAEQSNAANVIFYAKVSGAATHIFKFQADGTLLWGDGTSAVDTNLYRSAADTLKTDDSLVVVGSIKQSTTKTVLDTDHTAAADPHPAYRLESEVEANVYIQNPGTFTIPDTGRLTQPVRLTLSSINRLTNAGTGRAVVSDAPYDPSALKYRSPGSVALTSDEYVTEYQRVELRGNSRKSMFGTGRAIITGFDPIGRLVLAGSGGGS